MKRAFLSDCHAGQGESNHELRLQIHQAIAHGAAYLEQNDIRIATFMGDTVHHLGNTLQAAQTRKDISCEQLAPLAKLLASQETPANAIAGNTDWLLSDTNNLADMRELWFAFTGFPREKISFPQGGLWDEHVIEQADARLLTPHGHVFDRAQRQDMHRPRPSDYPRLLAELRDPSPAFIERISSPTGAHARSSSRMAQIGNYVKRLPDSIRPMVADAVGWAMKTQEFEPEFARLIAMSGVKREMRHRCYGLMGHSHIAGIRQYGGTIIVNTGSFGARNIQTQRATDQKAHVVVLDDEEGTLELVQTYDPADPHKRPITKKKLDLRTGKVG